jgi:hypothetical protein
MAKGLPPNKSPPTGKKSAGSRNWPKAAANGMVAKHDAPNSASTKGKSKGGAKRKGMR